MSKKQNQQNKRYQRTGSLPDKMVTAPVVMTTKRASGKARIQSRGNVTTVTHREYLQPIDGSAAYSVVSISCNPGLLTSFPWLGRMASMYEQYRFTKLRFSYKSVTSTSIPGVVMMSFDFDAADSPPATKVEQAQMANSTESSVWVGNELTVPSDPGWRFTRSSTLTNTDIKTYDLGNLLVSTMYGTGGVVGELYVDYTLELRKPAPWVGGPGTIDGGRLYSPSTDWAVPFSSSTVITGVNFPLRRYSNTSLEVIKQGEFILAVRYGVTVGTGNFPGLGMTVTSPLSEMAELMQSWTLSESVRVYRARLFVGDRINFSTTPSAATKLDIKIFVGSAQFTDLQ